MAGLRMHVIGAGVVASVRHLSGFFFFSGPFGLFYIRFVFLVGILFFSHNNSTKIVFFKQFQSKFSEPNGPYCAMCWRAGQVGRRGRGSKGRGEAELSGAKRGAV